MNTYRHQRGITLSGLITTSALLFGVGLTGMKLFPLYNELFKVKAAMKSVAGQPGIAGKSTTDIHKLLMRNFEVSDVETFTDANIRQYAKIERPKDGKNRIIRFQYEKRGQLFGPLDVVLKINETIDIAGAGAASD